MDCRYCFYQDEADKRAHGFAGMMSLETAEALVSTAMEYAEGACSFLFQGGEPTLAGLDFFTVASFSWKRNIASRAWLFK